MSRTIKFRAWYSHTPLMIYVEPGGDIGAVKSLAELFRLHDINHYQLMQFTGLKDKHGTDIYEGDLVDHYGLVKGFLGRYEIRWGLFGFTCWDKDRPDMNSHYISPNTPSSWLEVVGNIYEGASK